MAAAITLAVALALPGCVRHWPNKTEPLSGQVREMVVQQGEYFLAPARITVAPNTRVRLLVRNDGGQTHDLALPALRLSTPSVQPGQSYAFEFTAPRNSGDYRIVCTIPGHEAAGMHGVLLVR